MIELQALGEIDEQNSGTETGRVSPREYLRKIDPDHSGGKTTTGRSLDVAG